jgi:hypothetical protein
MAIAANRPEDWAPTEKRIKFLRHPTKYTAVKIMF